MGSRHILKSDESFFEYCKSCQQQGWIQLPPFTSALIEDISGNINRVRRVRFCDAKTGRVSSVIVKTVPEGGRLERFPSIHFPENRLDYEAAYYNTFAEIIDPNSALSTWTPHIMYFDAANAVIVMEDLSPAVTLDVFVQQQTLTLSMVAQIGTLLGQAHRATQVSEACFEPNPSMQVNIPYIISLPIQAPDKMQRHWDRLSNKAQWMQMQSEFLAHYQDDLLPIAMTLENTLSSSPEKVLVHGDLHPGSLFVREDQSITCIDAELCDYAPGWFDAGMLLAHLIMLGDPTDWDTISDCFLNHYLDANPASTTPSFITHIKQMAGFEMIRRNIGAANVHYIKRFEARPSVLQKAATIILAA